MLSNMEAAEAALTLLMIGIIYSIKTMVVVRCLVVFEGGVGGGEGYSRPFVKSSLTLLKVCSPFKNGLATSLHQTPPTILLIFY